MKNKILDCLFALLFIGFAFFIVITAIISTNSKTSINNTRNKINHIEFILELLDEPNEQIKKEIETIGKDDWDKDIKIQFVDNMFILTSSGPDKKFDTSDDIIKVGKFNKRNER